MATKVSSVDYKDMPKKAQQMRTEGKKLNNELVKAYSSIGAMSKNWYGKRYNTLVDSFNKMTGELNEMVKLVVSTIPDTLDTIAINYAKADGETPPRSSKEAPKKIADIKKSNATGMRFMETEVNSTKKNVETNFKNALSSMDQIQSIYKKINWKSEGAATAFEKKFTSLKNSIKQSFENIKKDFGTLMQQTITDMGAAEKSNTVS